MRVAVARLLRSAGAVCLGTGTHHDAAVQLAFEPLLDLAILDFQMPNGDLGGLVRRLHWQRPALPLVGRAGRIGAPSSPHGGSAISCRGPGRSTI
jgi:CheY-like chemotaxis protein